MSENPNDEISLSTWHKRPLAVTSLSWLYIAIGTIGFLYHAPELLVRNEFGYDSLWIELTELLAVVGGAFMLRGHNWARWLAIGWIALHVILSAFHPLTELMIHSALLAAIAGLLFCRPSALYFHGHSARD